MKKYLTVFSLSFENEFVYRLNFILWRLRNVLRILMTFFLWNSIFAHNKIAFGYSKEQMFAYVFLVLILSSFVMAAPSNDTIGSEISSGDLSNYLIKPIGYLRYWLTRDWASKLLNMLFVGGEVMLLYLILRPTIVLAASPFQFILGIIASIVAALTFFNITKLAVSVSFWNPEDTWSVMFLVMVLMETMAGVVFPLDILPANIGLALQFTPFPYLIYYPIAIIVGRLSLAVSLRILLQSLVWLALSAVGANRVWLFGLKSYAASGR